MPSINIRSYKIPLKWVLILPFVLQILGAVTLVGYLSYQSGKQSVEHLANDLLEEISGRVSDRLKTYLEMPQMLIEQNKRALEAGEINWNDFDALEAHFFREIEQFESITVLSFGNTQGEVIGVGRDRLGIITDPGSLTIWEARGKTPRIRRFIVLMIKATERRSFIPHLILMSLRWDGIKEQLVKSNRNGLPLLRMLAFQWL